MHHYPKGMVRKVSLVGDDIISQNQPLDNQISLGAKMDIGTRQANRIVMKKDSV